MLMPHVLPVPAAMLKRTEEMREQRYKERLDDYYRRNFKVGFKGGVRSDLLHIMH
jgi:hypothetical protein